ncbi:MAG: DUF47 family protein [Actinobacteria bacterium]|nr:DUF47 family protein [Actinomycetota bacterium]
MMLWKKQKEIEQAVQDYLAETENCLSAFIEALDVYFAEGRSSNFEQRIEKTHGHESKADDKRREIEYAMYNRALIPESRGDILGMLEAIDLVPNKCESVLYQIWYQNMSIPQEYADKLKNLAQVNRESFTLLCKAIRYLFTDIEQAVPTIDMVGEKESESDRMERMLIKDIFSSPGDKADKILLKEVILEIGAISDRSENAADRVRIVTVKRKA